MPFFVMATLSCPVAIKSCNSLYSVYFPTQNFTRLHMVMITTGLSIITKIFQSSFVKASYFIPVSDQFAGIISVYNEHTINNGNMAQYRYYITQRPSSQHQRTIKQHRKERKNDNEKEKHEDI